MPSSLRAEVISRVEELVEPLLKSEGMELVHIEYRREPKGWVLRLYADKEGGITLDDLARISKDVNALLDVEDIISGRYFLEVSSPGPNRPIGGARDFKRFAGRKAHVVTLEKFGDRRNFRGRLLGCDGVEVRMEVEGVERRIPLDLIQKANLDEEN